MPGWSKGKGRHFSVTFRKYLELLLFRARQPLWVSGAFALSEGRRGSCIA